MLYQNFLTSPSEMLREYCKFVNIEVLQRNEGSKAASTSFPWTHPSDVFKVKKAIKTIIMRSRKCRSKRSADEIAL